MTHEQEHFKSVANMDFMSQMSVMLTVSFHVQKSLIKFPTCT